MGCEMDKSSISKLILKKCWEYKIFKENQIGSRQHILLKLLNCFVLFKLKCVGICLSAYLSDWCVCIGSLHEETCYEKLCLAFTLVPDPCSFLLSNTVECHTQSHIPEIFRVTVSDALTCKDCIQFSKKEKFNV